MRREKLPHVIRLRSYRQLNPRRRLADELELDKPEASTNEALCHAKDARPAHDLLCRGVKVLLLMAMHLIPSFLKSASEPTTCCSRSSRMRSPSAKRQAIAMRPRQDAARR